MDHKQMSAWVQESPMATIRSIVGAESSPGLFTEAEARLAGDAVGLFVRLHAATVAARRSLGGDITRREARRLLDDIADAFDGLERLQPLLRAALKFLAKYRQLQANLEDTRAACDDANCAIQVDIAAALALMGARKRVSMIDSTSDTKI